MTDEQAPPPAPMTPDDRPMNPYAPYQSIPEPTARPVTPGETQTHETWAPATSAPPAWAPAEPVSPAAPPSTIERRDGASRRGGGLLGIAAVVLLSAMLAAGGTAALVAGPLRSTPTAAPAGAPAVAAAASATSAPAPELTDVVAAVRDSVVTITSEGFS